MAFTRTPDLLLGFAIFSGYTRSDGTRMYHHIAVAADDRMWITEDFFPLSEGHFDTPDRKWKTLEGSTVNEVLENPQDHDFHWLGNYPHLFNAS